MLSKWVLDKSFVLGNEHCFLITVKISSKLDIKFTALKINLNALVHSECKLNMLHRNSFASFVIAIKGRTQ